MKTIDELTIGEAKERLKTARAEVTELSELFGRVADVQVDATAKLAEPKPVLVCTDKRGVVFGYTDQPGADPMPVTKARMCLYWSTAMGGVFGLTDKGPDSACKISATAEAVTLSGVTAVFDLSDDAIAAWLRAPVQGR